jgi:methionyl-tRNA formyltransferase
MKVVFCGTPDFAIPSLEALLNSSFDVVAVITQPDKPRGRGHKMMPCPVKQYALEQCLEVYSFERIRNKENVEILKKLDYDVMVTAAYGQILSQKILDIPKYGVVNVHASLLPKYRGAAPIQWSIINGDKVTGITTMLTERGVDCGDILLQKETEILPNETSGELFERLSQMGGEVLVATLNGLAKGTITPRKQDNDAATHYHILEKKDGKIDFNKTAKQIKDLIRGVCPWPGAYTCINDLILIVWSCDIVDNKATGKPGSIAKCDSKYGIIVNTSDKQIVLKEIQLSGKRRMDAKNVVCGRTIDSSMVFK